jgi:uncharacterized protein (TIGR02246 family)
MPSTAKKSSRSSIDRVNRTARGSRKATAAASRKVTAPATIRQIGDDWARHWNAGELDGVVATYAEDAVYLPPHHEAVHGREAIRKYLQVPLGHGVSDLAFEVTYIKQQGPIAWDVGTYRMSVPQSDGTKRADHGKYLSVWRRVGKNWLLAADAWSSDLPASA